MSVRTLARQTRDSARNVIRHVQLRRGLSALARAFASGRTPNIALMEQLVYGWGNEAWSASALFLGAMFKWLPQTSDSVLECGSGLSTLLLATAAALTGRRICSLEHDVAWATLIERRTPEQLKYRVSLSVAPLTSYGEFEWYSINAAVIPASIGFVVCDGPPASTRGGRYGLGPVLGPRLVPGAVILLDDTQRPEERAIVHRWCSELGATVVEEGGTFTALRVGTAARIEPGLRPA